MRAPFESDSFGLLDLVSNRVTTPPSLHLLPALVDDHARCELAATRDQRGGFRRRAVWLLTNCPHKLAETRKSLGRYGIEVLRAPWIPELTGAPYLRALLSTTHENVTILSVLEERTDLLDGRSNAADLSSDGLSVDHVSVLAVHHLASHGDRIETDHYAYRTPGKLDLSLRREDDAAVFGWDDVFVIEKAGRTYQDMRDRGLKVSSREMVFSRYLREHIYYRELKNLNFNAPEMARPVDFATDPARFLRESAFFHNAVAEEWGLVGLFTQTANDGLFFRAPENRRQLNYFTPGLNSGVPLTAKPNAFHEATYLAHDLGHELIPDLLYDRAGEAAADEATAALDRRVYVVHRMIGEAVTLVLADVLFADTLYRSGVQPAGGERAVFRFFRASGLDFSNPETRLATLRTMLRANVELCLLGEDAKLRALAGGRPEALAALEDYKRYFFPLFISDYRWNVRNFEYLRRNAAEISAWTELATPIFRAHALERPTLGETVARLGLDSATSVEALVSRVFDDLFERRIRPVFEPVFAGEPLALRPREERLAKAAARYFTGQMAIFAKFDWVPESAACRTRISELLLARAGGMSLADIDVLRGYYEEYLGILVSRNLISGDDFWTYREIYAIFEPFFVSYLEKTDIELDALAREILGTPTPSSLAELKSGLDSFFAANANQVSEPRFRELAPILSKRALVSVLRGILADPTALATIAARSYAHSLGFSKITLLEDWKGRGYDVRLHIWWPQAERIEKGVAVAEGRHEHRWDFASRLISGALENHKYRIEDLNPAQQALFARFERALEGLSSAEIEGMTERLDGWEILDRGEADSRMVAASGGMDRLRALVAEEDLRARLGGLSPDELREISRIYVKYANRLDPATGTERYQSHGARLLAFAGVDRHAAGELYHHPLRFAHRLFVDPTEFVSTFILTGPGYPGQSPGEFVHTSVGREEKAVRGRQFYTAETLRKDLEVYLQRIEA